MTSTEWDRLEELGSDGGEEATQLLQMTEQEDEHPEGYEGPCSCRLCQSYGE